LLARLFVALRRAVPDRFVETFAFDLVLRADLGAFFAFSILAISLSPISLPNRKLDRLPKRIRKTCEIMLMMDGLMRR
jgi:hypothetical protein